MNTLEAKKTAKKLIDLLADWDFEICLERPHKWMKEHQDLMEVRDISIFYGATKVVVDFEEQNFVLKFDMHRAIGLCALEAANYENAVSAGLAEYFARTYYLGEYFGSTVSIQEKVVVDADENHCSFVNYYTSDGESEEDADWMVDNEMGDYERFMAIFTDKDYNLTDKAANWILDEIDGYQFDADFHEGNFGRTLEGDMVLFDFSGYSYFGRQ